MDVSRSDNGRQVQGCVGNTLPEFSPSAGRGKGYLLFPCRSLLWTNGVTEAERAQSVSAPPRPGGFEGVITDSPIDPRPARHRLANPRGLAPPGHRSPVPANGRSTIALRGIAANGSGHRREIPSRASQQQRFEPSRGCVRRRLRKNASAAEHKVPTRRMRVGGPGRLLPFPFAQAKGEWGRQRCVEWAATGGTGVAHCQRRMCRGGLPFGSERGTHGTAARNGRKPDHDCGVSRCKRGRCSWTAFFQSPSLVILSSAA